MKFQHKAGRLYWNTQANEKGLRKVTAQEIAELAGIHCATFYMYYDSINLVLDSIKDRQLALLAEVLCPPRARENDYSEFLGSIQRYFEENRTYLEPLVCAYQDNEFALRYRSILKEELRKDLEFPLFPDGTKDYFVIDTILSAFIETLIQTLRTGLRASLSGSDALPQLVQNLPFSLAQADRSAMVSITSQCSAILPSSTRQRS